MRVVTTTIRVELEIETDSNWSPETQIKQVTKQSLDSANMKLNRLLVTDPSMKVCGKPVCLTIQVGEDK